MTRCYMCLCSCECIYMYFHVGQRYMPMHVCICRDSRSTTSICYLGILLLVFRNKIPYWAPDLLISLDGWSASHRDSLSWLPQCYNYMCLQPHPGLCFVFVIFFNVNVGIWAQVHMFMGLELYYWANCQVLPFGVHCFQLSYFSSSELEKILKGISFQIFTELQVS